MYFFFIKENKCIRVFYLLMKKYIFENVFLVVVNMNNGTNNVVNMKILIFYIW